jgi:hypothetical protein
LPCLRNQESNTLSTIDNAFHFMQHCICATLDNMLHIQLCLFSWDPQLPSCFVSIWQVPTTSLVFTFIRYICWLWQAHNYELHLFTNLCVLNNDKISLFFHIKSTVHSLRTVWTIVLHSSNKKLLLFHHWSFVIKKVLVVVQKKHMMTLRLWIDSITKFVYFLVLTFTKKTGSLCKINMHNGHRPMMGKWQCN